MTYLILVFIINRVYTVYTAYILYMFILRAPFFLLQYYFLFLLPSFHTLFLLLLPSKLILVDSLVFFNLNSILN